MHEGDPSKIPLSHYAVIVAWSGLGGLASFLHRLRMGTLTHSIWLELIADMTYSAFAGLLAFFLCNWLAYPEMLSAIIIGIAGHMGARLIMIIEHRVSKRFQDEQDQPP